MQPRLILLDADGVLWRGQTVIPEAPGFIRAARAAGLRCVLVSNNAGPDRAAYRAKCRRLGLELEEQDLFSVNHLAGPFMAQHYPGAHVLVLGSEELARGMAAYCDVVSTEQWLRQHGVPSLLDGQGRMATAEDVALVRAARADVVFAGIDHNVNYLKLALACVAVQRGAALVGANMDPTFPIEDGLQLPGNGATVRLLETVCGVPARFIGKPEPYLLEQIEAECGVPRAAMLMVGDRIATDIEFAHRGGIAACLVLTGVDRAENLPPGGDVRVAATLAELAAQLGL
jgi:4-nitrophenyl phosphatase